MIVDTRTPFTETRAPIRVLPEEIANRIAAGEVVERPASVLKELIENAIDAGATRVCVDAAEGGIRFLRVVDDGRGIPFDEVPLAITHHATSKISAFDDIGRIGTLGFRGEALASVSDVAEVTITTKTEEADEGALLEVRGGKIVRHTYAPARKGTILEVKNLFYNIPARYKFLNHPSRELVRLKEVFEGALLTYHAVAFSFAHNEGNAERYDHALTRKARLADFLGKDLAGHLISFELREETFAVEGYVSDMSLHQGAFRNKWVFVNGRPVENKAIAFACRNAYHGVIPKERFPYLFLYISLPAETIDVNVHPSKREVKLKNERAIAGAIHKAVKHLFAHKQSFHSVPIPPPAQKGLPMREAASFSQTFRNNKDHHAPARSTDERMKEATRPQEQEEEDDAHEESIQKAAASPDTRGDEERETIEHAYRVVGQSFLSYIIVEEGNDLLLIDQHAAYERLNFERIKRAIQNERIPYERLLVPLEIELTASEVQTLMNAKDALAKIGIRFELLDTRCIVIEELPRYFKTEKGETFVKDVLDRFLFDEGAFRFDRMLDDVIEDIACKRSPKAGAPLSREDMETLLRELKEEGVLSACPHGRPFILRLEKGYLDKKFRRT